MKKISTAFIAAHCAVTALCSILYICFPDMKNMIFFIWYALTIAFWAVTAVVFIVMYAKLIKIKRRFKGKDDKK